MEEITSDTEAVHSVQVHVLHRMSSDRVSPFDRLTRLGDDQDQLDF
jgi:hypothetical protein